MCPRHIAEPFAIIRLLRRRIEAVAYCGTALCFRRRIIGSDESANYFGDLAVKAINEPEYDWTIRSTFTRM